MRGRDARWRGWVAALCAFAVVPVFAGCDTDLGSHDLRVSPSPAGVGQEVEFYASVRSEEKSDAKRVRRDRVSFKWDLDGDGVFETVSPTVSPDGSSAPSDIRSSFDTDATRTYGQAQQVKIASLVSLRAADFGAIGGLLGFGDATVKEQMLTIQPEPPPPPGPDEPPPPAANRPPFASFAVTPNPVEPHETVTLDAQAASDSDGSIAKYEWNIDGLGDYDRDTGTTPTTQMHFDNSGTYTVGLRVTDDEGATATTTRQVIVRWETRTGRVPLRAAAMPRFEFSPDGREVNDGRFLLNGNELILDRARARGTLPSDHFPKRLRGSHDVRWAADYVATRAVDSGASEVEAFVLLTFPTGGRACLGADLTGGPGEDAKGSFRVIGAVGKASRLRGLGTATGTLDDEGRPLVSGRGEFRLGKHAEFGLGKSRCGPLRRLAPQRD